MKTKRQEELVSAFLAEAGEKDGPVYRELIGWLEGLGYYPQKERANLSFKHDLHNKQMAKMGIKKGKAASPFFALRFSACRGYSKRFADIVSGAIAKYPTRAARCIEGGCGFCSGGADTHVYAQTLPGGARGTHCGAYALEIPGMGAEDLEEIKGLIREEHEYLMKHEAGAAV